MTVEEQLSLEQRCVELVSELGLGDPSQVTCVEPLSGGVASDVAKVEVGDKRFCLKFALPKLKVKEDWFAPVKRNRAEYEWLRVAGEVAPTSALRLFGCSETKYGFALEFLQGDDVYLWKSALLDGQQNEGEAEQVGDLLGRIHAASAATGFDTSHFLNEEDFHAMRVEPYLLFTASRRPEVADVLQGLARMLTESKNVLVHGDVSPKNIFFRDTGPVLLDGECADMGDASFDPAFCLNHLALKAIHLPASRTFLLDQFEAFWKAYAQHVNWEDVAALEERVCLLMSAFMLARIDGKSPVEYLEPSVQPKVRDLAVSLLTCPVTSVGALRTTIEKKIKEF